MYVRMSFATYAKNSKDKNQGIADAGISNSDKMTGV